MCAMRLNDQERLHKPYDSVERNPARLAKALGVHVDNVDALAAEILRDLDPSILGVGWWAPHIATPLRILISDHLYLCVSSIETNLVESKVHYLEARGDGEEQERRLRTAVTVDVSGKVSFKPQPSSSPMDDLVGVRLDMHIVGCVRALASALDCLGGAVLGVLALPKPVLKASYHTACNALRDVAKKGGNTIQVKHGKKILEEIAAAGPPGWDDWVLGFRNMLVHRGRRMWMKKIVPTGAYLHMPRGGAVFSSHIVPMLPSDPDRSEIEVLRDARTEKLLLTENGWDTLAAAIESTRFTLDRSAAQLCEAWVKRRENPRALIQPPEQWPGPKTEMAPFTGFAPGTVPFDPTELHTHPSFGVRIKAAAVDDAERSRWRDFK
jgi:hypothetical protein